VLWETQVTAKTDKKKGQKKRQLISSSSGNENSETSQDGALVTFNQGPYAKHDGNGNENVTKQKV